MSRRRVGTVIAYDGETLASDSMVSFGDGHFSHNTRKLFRLPSGGIIGAAGDADIRDVFRLFANAHAEKDFPTRQELNQTRTDCSILLVLPNREVFNIDIELVDQTFDVWNSSILRVPSRIAIGHGSDYAHTILDYGGTSVDAVKAAIKRSLFCGGPVQTMTLEPVKKKKTPKAEAPKIES